MKLDEIVLISVGPVAVDVTVIVDSGGEVPVPQVEDAVLVLFA